MKLSQLEQKLRQHAKISVSMEQKERLKQNILSCINSEKKVAPFGRLIESLRTLAASISPREYFKTLLKEKLITLVEFQNRRQYAFQWLSLRKAVAAFIVVVFVITLFFNFPFLIDRVEASFSTVIEEVEGEVIILREGNIIQAKPSLALKADDVIKTGVSSRATILFLDQSVSRLSENTEVKISKLFVNPGNNTQTIVELVLFKGRLWSRVVNLIDNLSRFQVKAGNSVTVAKKKAAFDVTLQQKGKAKVSAIHNRVDLVVSTDKKVVETTLVKGFSAEVKTGIPVTNITSDKKEAEGDSWVTENLAEDKKYIEEVKQGARENMEQQVKVMPGSPLYAVKELSETTQIAFTFDTFEKQKKILTSAHEKLAEAEVFLGKGDQAKALALLEEFKKITAGIFEWIKNHEAEDSAQALELKKQLTEILGWYQKQLVLTLPNEQLYPLKDAVAQTQLLLAGSDEVQKTEEKLKQASGKLLEAHDLAEQGDTAAATEQVTAYNEAISKVVSEVKELPDDTKEQAVNAILDNKADDLKTLEAISGAAESVSSPPSVPVDVVPDAAPPIPEIVLPPSNSDEQSVTEVVQTPQAINPQAGELKQTVIDAKTEALTKLGEAVLDVQNNQSSLEVMQKVDTLNKIEVNGKTIVDLKLSPNSFTITSGSGVISVTSPPPQPPQTKDSKIPVSPPKQP